MKTKAFTLLELLFVVAVIAILAAIAVPNFLEAQTRSKVSRTRMDLAAVGLALDAYQADWRAYPPYSAAAAARIHEVTSKSLPLPIPTAAEHGAADQSLNRYHEVGDPFADFGLPSLGTAADTPTTQTIEAIGRVVARESWALARLTTPVAYLVGTVPFDPFADSRMAPMVYVDTAPVDLALPAVRERVPPRRYVLFSVGPDVDSAQLTNGITSADRIASFALTRSTLHPVLGPFQPYDPTNGTISLGDLYHFGMRSQLESPRPPIVWD